MRGVGASIDRLLPRGIVDAVWQFFLFLAAYQGYQLVRGLTDSGAIAAYTNAHHVMDLEKSMGSFFEPGLQQALIDHASWAVDFANFMYLNSHFVITTGFLAWLYLFRNEYFYFVRNMFMVAMGLALVGYVAFPTAPPRMFPSEGFTDTIASFTGAAQDSKTASLLLNQYAAVPSMHIAFSMMVGLSAAALAQRRISRVLWSAYPLVVFFVIVATGNHYWVDAAAGGVVACLAGAAAAQLARLRPEAWGWPARAREATV